VLPSLDWQLESGFESRFACKKFVFETVRQANIKLLGSPGKKIVLAIVDGHLPSDHGIDQNSILVTNCKYRQGAFDPDQFEIFPDSWYGQYHGSVSVDDAHDPIWGYNCFIARMDIFRQSWLYQLIRRDLLKHGLVSFTMDLSRHLSTGMCTPDQSAQDVFQQQFEQQLAIFRNEHDMIKNQVPYRNFDHSLPLSQVVMDTKCSLVLETWFHDNILITYSEKIFRALKLPRPWLLFSTQYAVQNLQSMGFDVLDDIVDHNYDQQPDAIIRQSMILDQLQILNDLKFNDAVKNRLQVAARHNVNRLNDLYQSFNKDVIDTVQRAVQRLEARSCC
jgi:hypothetical protein